MTLTQRERTARFIRHRTGDGNVIHVTLEKLPISLEGESPEQPAPDCAECARLMAEYRRLRSVYATAVELLFATGYQVTDAEHEELKAAAAEARLESETAGLELENHKLMHATAKSNRSAGAST